MRKPFLISLIISLIFSGCAFANTSNIFQDEQNPSFQLLKLQVEQNDMLKNVEPSDDLVEEETVPTTAVVKTQKMKIIDKVPQKGEPVEGQLEVTTTRSDFWHFIKGKPMDDGIMLGMISYHTSPNGRDFNEMNNLIALQYKGWFLGTFKNSFYDQSIFGGVSRKVWEHKYGKDFKMTVQYKAGLLWGYKDRYPNICGVSPLPIPMVGFNYKKVGVDVSLIPSNYPIFFGNLRMDFPEFKKAKKTPITTGQANTK